MILKATRHHTEKNAANFALNPTFESDQGRDYDAVMIPAAALSILHPA